MNPKNIFEGIIGIPKYIRNVAGNAQSALDRFIPGDQSRKPPPLPQIQQPQQQPQLSEDEIIAQLRSGQIDENEANRLLNLGQQINVGTPSPTPTPQPQVQGAVSPEQLQAGFNRFSQTPPPIAQYIPQLIQAGEGLPDPLMPAIVALMETGGLDPAKTATPNNPYNIGPGISYPDPQTAIIGGGPNNQQGFAGVLNSGLYNDYLQSGNLADFFNKFTPPGAQYGNPSMEDLIRSYMQLRSLFGE